MGNFIGTDYHTYILISWHILNLEFINWILMQKSDYSSKRVQDFPEIDAESSCLGFGPVLVVVGWINSGIPPIITLNKMMMMVLMVRMGWGQQCYSLILHQTAWHPP